MISNLQNYFQIGGPVVWFLACFSLLATTVFLFKVRQLWFYYKLSGNSAEQALSLIEDGHDKEALLLLKKQRSPRAQSLSHSLHISTHKLLDYTQFQQESMRFAKTLITKLNSHLRILEVIATLAPLLGLFGTVLGMISAFRAMEAAGSQVDPSVLSGGIWQALLTTAVGLAVAIPVSLAHSWLERRVESETSTMEDDLGRVFTQVAKDQHDNPSSNIRRLANS